MKKILVFPKDPNPYQELLYSQLRKKGFQVDYLKLPTSSHTIGMFFLGLYILLYRFKGYSIFHLHWLYDFSFQSNSPLFSNTITRLFFTWYACVTFVWIKMCGYKLVWTVHNIVPHQPLFVNNLWVTKLLALLADKKIVHSQATIDEMKQLNISTRNTTIIPIGMYNSYPNTISREDARKKLNIPIHAFVFLFFGKIEPYKGVTQLLEAFKKYNVIARRNDEAIPLLSNKSLYNADPDVQGIAALTACARNDVMIIAGNTSDVTLKQAIESYKDHPNITLCLQFIPADEVQVFMNAADVVVCPYTKVTTSSLVSLALAFNKPVIYPRIGNLKDIPEGVGIAYDPEEPLNKVLEKARHRPLDDYQQTIQEYIKAFSWDVIAEKTKQVLEG
jgi:glycosyltransferase involved in cell wall biosynthesis